MKLGIFIGFGTWATGIWFCGGRGCDAQCASWRVAIFLGCLMDVHPSRGDVWHIVMRQSSWNLSLEYSRLFRFFESELRSENRWLSRSFPVRRNRLASFFDRVWLGLLCQLYSFPNLVNKFLSEWYLVCFLRFGDFGSLAHKMPVFSDPACVLETSKLIIATSWVNCAIAQEVLCFKFWKSLFLSMRWACFLKEDMPSSFSSRFFNLSPFEIRICHSSWNWTQWEVIPETTADRVCSGSDSMVLRTKSSACNRLY